MRWVDPSLHLLCGLSDVIHRFCNSVGDCLYVLALGHIAIVCGLAGPFHCGMALSVAAPLSFRIVD